MKHTAALAFALAGCVLLPACSGDATGPDADLVGYWNLPYQETPAIYGMVSAQVIFRPDGSFLFHGTNPLSMGPLATVEVTGSWTRDGDLLTLTAGDAESRWRLEFLEDARLRFTAEADGEGFVLFRPGPD